MYRGAQERGTTATVQTHENMGETLPWLRLSAGGVGNLVKIDAIMKAEKYCQILIETHNGNYGLASPERGPRHH